MPTTTRIRSTTLFMALVLAALSPAVADRIDVVGRIDLAPILGPVPPDYRVRAIAHDGASLWLVHPAGDRLLRVHPASGALLGSPKLVGRARIEPVGMTFAEGSLWVLNALERELLRVAPTGRVLSATSLRGFEGALLGVDFLPAAPGRRGLLYVVLRGTSDLSDHLIGWELRDGRMVFSRDDAMALGNSSAIASTVIEGVPYTWVALPRSFWTRIEGDEEERPPLQKALTNKQVTAPDDSIPRGGEDWQSSHALALTDPLGKRVLWEMYAVGKPAEDIATAGDMLFYPMGAELVIAQLMRQYDHVYGACAIRDIRFYQSDVHDAPVTVHLNFAVPYDPAIGPNGIYLEDQTAGYLAQRIVAWLGEDPPGGYRDTYYTQVHGEAVIRHGIAFWSPSSATPEQSYSVRVEVCDASRNVDPALVWGVETIPDRERTLFFYDGDGDGSGDDDPLTCADDFYRLDDAVVDRHFQASGAAGEANLYDKAWRIHEYVKRRHVYSGSDGGWADPVKKLESPYATCSPTAFMVAALARKAGIPSRIVGTTKQRGTLNPGDSARDYDFHRWAQVYLPPYGWVRVDSTPVGPATLGFTDVNGDGSYDECDLCTSDAQCQSSYDKSFADCSISTVPGAFTNFNDFDSDGDVDGDDIDAIGAWYWTQARLARGFAAGIGTADLVTMVQTGVPDEYLEMRYYAQEIERRGTHCDATVNRGNDWQRYAEWTNPLGIFGVVVFFTPDTKAATDAVVSWSALGPLQQGEAVRIDLYERWWDQGQRPHYRFLRALARDVPALAKSHPVTLAPLPPAGELVVAVTRQGGAPDLLFTPLPRADWGTYGVSEPVQK